MKIFNNNEYGKIQTYIMRTPNYFDIIDENNKYKGKVNYAKVVDNLNNLINILNEEGVAVKLLPTSKSVSEVFTRDLGFVILETLFICNLKNRYRKGEVKELIKFAKTNNIKYYIFENEIEGGDVIVHNNVVFVGLSDRTDKRAIDELNTYLAKNRIKFKAIGVRFNKSKLHLDCVFNPISRSKALICDYVYDIDIIKKYIKGLIFVPNRICDELGINIIPIGKKRVITSSSYIARVLRKEGFKSIFCEYSEIIKAGGGLRCSTLSLSRKNLYNMHKFRLHIKKM